MKFAVPIFIGLALLLFSALFFRSPVFAQSVNQPHQLQQMSQSSDTNVPQNLHTYTQSAMIEIMASILCQLTGKDPINPNQQCLGIDTSTGKIGYVANQGGLIGIEKNMIVALYTPPLHTGDFFNFVAKNFGIAKSTYAQTTGVGFNSLSPLLGLWSAFRNLVYVIFVFIFIAIGLAIMLRVRIDPRTVMTVQNQIPRLIVGLVLITFSFALAGFMVDMMYVVSYLSISLISTADPNIAKNSPDIAIQLINAGNPIGAINIATSSTTNNICIGDVCNNVGLAGIVNNSAGAVGSFLGPLFANPAGAAIMGFIMSVIGYTGGSTAGGLIGTLLGGIVGVIGLLAVVGTGGALAPLVLGIFTAASSGAIAGSQLGGAVGAIFGATQASNIAAGFISIVAWLVIAITIMFSLFRLWFQLIIAYINIILDVIFAPFWILAGLVPGSKIGFSAWFRDLVANLAAFPATLILFLLARVIIDAFGPTQKDIFVAPLIGNPSQLGQIASLIGLGIILITPEVVKIAKNVLKAPNLPTDVARKEFGVGGAALGFVGGSIWSRLYYRHYDQDEHKYVTGGPVGSQVNKLFRNVRSRLPNKGANVGQDVSSEGTGPTKPTGPASTQGFRWTRRK